jgi:hypothetical protein
MTMVMVLLMMMGLGLVLGFLAAAWMVRDTDGTRKPARRRTDRATLRRR